MKDKPSRSLPAGQQQRMFLLLAVLLALLASWLGWSGWQQWRGESRLGAIESARDQAVQGTSSAIQAETARIKTQLATPAVSAALASGNLAGAGDAIRAGWPQAERVDVIPADLQAVYGRLPDVGYGRLAAAEAALAAKGPVLRVVREEGSARVLVAAPARAASANAALADPAPAASAPMEVVAVVRLPLKQLTAAFEAAPLGSGYLALRQGEASIVERGNQSLSGMAETLATDVGSSGLRVSAAAPARGDAVMGLGAIPALVAAAVLAVLAVLCLLLMRRGVAGLIPKRGAVAEAVAEPTLAQALKQGSMPEPEQASTAASPSTTSPATDTASDTTTTEDPAMIQARADNPAEPAQDPVTIDPSIFRAYDIRGVVGESLDVGVAEYIGHAIGSLMHEQDLTDIVVGRDGRLSGPDMVAGLVAGLRKAGRNVIDIGLAPTPLVYFGSFQLRTGCCVAVTGSHNPPDYNGFKIVVGAETLSGDAITDLYQRIATGRLHSAPQPGTLSQQTIDDDYVNRIDSDMLLARPLKVVVDAGNGVAGVLGPRVLSAIGAQVIPLYCEIDGTFPNHHPDPSEPHNLQDLIARVRAEGADLGVAFDGDGDRLGVVTPEGDNIFPDRLLMLFAADVLQRRPGAVILYDVKCTGHLASHILQHGGSPLMWKTGHSLIKAKMRETGAELAGEMSGHFFFGERWFGFDDGIYAAARLLEILANRSESAGDVLRALPGGVSTPEIKIEAPNADPHGFVEAFRQQASFGDDARISSIDGVRVDWPDGWGLIRASNTTPVLVLRFDADDQAALDRIQRVFRQQLSAFAPRLPIPF